MFNTLLGPPAAAARSARPPRRGAAHWFVLSAATLKFSLLAGCALDTRPGDGVSTDGLEVTVAPTLVYDAGGPDLKDLVPCTAVPLFQEKVVPHFIKSCAPKCHDGTKGMALIDLPMGFLMEDPVSWCGAALKLGVTSTIAKKLDAPLLTSSDPANLAHKHEFKYMTAAEFNAFRDDVMVWITAERPDLP
jgi:hypothetical protein